MIVGTGVDICEVARIAHSIERFGDRFLARIFTPQEIEYCRSKANSNERFAARFAAKEAAMKALGTGLSQSVRWREFEVARVAGGRPTMLLHGRAQQISCSLGATRAHLSLTHVRDQAIAFVVLESD